MIGSACAAILALANVAADPSDVSVVKVIVRDSFGRPLPGASVTLTSIGPNEIFRSVGGEAKFDKIPTGLYELDVSLPGFVPRKERLQIYQPNLTFRVGLDLGYNHNSVSPMLSGSAPDEWRGAPDLWVRLMPLYGGDLVENAVDRSGRFQLLGMYPGKYLLILFQGEKPLTMKPLDVLGGKQIVEFPELTTPRH
jgi:hypothetical protein